MTQHIEELPNLSALRMSEEYNVHRAFDNLKSEITRLRQDKAELVKTLKAVEFIWLQESAVETCPWCGGTKIVGHAEDCPHQAAITKAGKES